MDVAVRVQCFDPALFTEEFQAASNTREKILAKVKGRIQDVLSKIKGGPSGTQRLIKNSDELHFEIHLSGGNLLN